MVCASASSDLPNSSADGVAGMSTSTDLSPFRSEMSFALCYRDASVQKFMSGGIDEIPLFLRDLDHLAVIASEHFSIALAKLEYHQAPQVHR